MKALKIILVVVLLVLVAIGGCLYYVGKVIPERVAVKTAFPEPEITDRDRRVVTGLMEAEDPGGAGKVTLTDAQATLLIREIAARHEGIGLEKVNVEFRKDGTAHVEALVSVRDLLEHQGEFVPPQLGALETVQASGDVRFESDGDSCRYHILSASLGAQTPAHGHNQHTGQGPEPVQSFQCGGHGGENRDHTEAVDGGNRVPGARFFDQETKNGAVHPVHTSHGAFTPVSSSEPRTKQNVHPWPRPWDSTQIRPPWTSTIRRARARPTPVPFLRSSFSKSPNAFS